MDIWSALWPKANATVEENMQWKMLVTAAMYALLVNAGWAFANYAKAQDVKQVVVAQLEDQIWQAQKERCLQPIGSRLREILADRVQKLTSAYYEKAEKPYQLPACAEFGGQG